MSFGVSLTRALGFGNSRLTIITSAFLCILLFFYIFSLGSFLNINIFILQNGITYDTFFHFFIVSSQIDHIIIAICFISWLTLSLVERQRAILLGIFAGLLTFGVIFSYNISVLIISYIALLSIPTVIVLSICNKFVRKKFLNIHSDLFWRYFAIIAISIGIITNMIIIARIFSIHGQAISLRDYANYIFVLFSSASPILIALIIFCIPLKVLANGIMAKFSIIQETSISNFFSGSVTIRSKCIFIPLIMLLSVVLAVVPHLPTVNHNHQLVGSDTSAYVGWQNKLSHAKNTRDLFHLAFFTIMTGDRPITLLIIYGLVDVVKIDTSVLVDNLPIILAPLLVIAVYFFTRELSSSDKVSLMAALFTAVSFQTLIGIYAGYYSNWVALIVGYLGFTFLFKYLKNAGKTNLILFSILMVLLLLSHEYTWTVIIIVAGVFLVLMFATNRYRRTNVVLLLVVILSTVIIDVVKTNIIGVSNGFGRDLSVAHRQQAGINQFANRWNNLKDTMQNYYGALFSNFIVLGLALYWVLRCNFREINSIFFLIFFSIGILPLLFGDWIVQSRVFYDIPFQIPAALALTYIKRDDKGIMILLPICIWLISISIRNAYNFTFPS